MNKEKIHFKGINGLRFFSASAVILSHIELIKMAFGYSHFWNHPFFFYLGGIGVYFFFVLSGFLISYLLLKEFEQTQTISVKNFYIRRMLRIWPLYYLIVIVGFFILPHFSQIKINYLENSFRSHYYSMLILYLLMLPNFATALFGHVPHIGHLWTIGVEEQFYILWPLVIKNIMKRKINFIKVILMLISIIIIVKAIVLGIYIFNNHHPTLIPIKEFLAGFKIECMAIGSIGAYLYWSKNPILNIFYKSSIHVLSWLFIPILIFYTPSWLQDGNHIIYSILFVIIILNVSTNPNSFIKLENTVFNFLGKISYGIYMYHFMIIPVVLVLLKYVGIDINSIYGNVLLYSLVFIFTIFIATLSYLVFENKFLTLKEKFAVVYSKM